MSGDICIHASVCFRPTSLTCAEKSCLNYLNRNHLISQLTEDIYIQIKYRERKDILDALDNALKYGGVTGLMDKISEYRRSV